MDSGWIVPSQPALVEEADVLCLGNPWMGRISTSSLVTWPASGRWVWEPAIRAVGTGEPVQLDGSGDEGLPAV